MICMFYVYHWSKPSDTFVANFVSLKSLFRKAAAINTNGVSYSFTPIHPLWNKSNIDCKINPWNTLVYLSLAYHKIHFRNCKTLRKRNIAKDRIQLLVCVFSTGGEKQNFELLGFFSCSYWISLKQVLIWIDINIRYRYRYKYSNAWKYISDLIEFEACGNFFVSLRICCSLFEAQKKNRIRWKLLN